MLDRLLTIAWVLAILAANIVGAILVAYLLSPFTPWSVEALWLPILGWMILAGLATRRR